MGKRKKAAKKPQQSRQKVPLGEHKVTVGDAAEDNQIPHLHVSSATTTSRLLYVWIARREWRSWCVGCATSGIRAKYIVSALADYDAQLTRRRRPD